jgi:hypothetical protein
LYSFGFVLNEFRISFTKSYSLIMATSTLSSTVFHKIYLRCSRYGTSSYCTHDILSRSVVVVHNEGYQILTKGDGPFKVLSKIKKNNACKDLASR